MILIYVMNYEKNFVCIYTENEYENYLLDTYFNEDQVIYGA